MSLAIVIPYFRFRFFEKTLQSLAGQTDKRFKVYIGDDASGENPEALLESFQGKFDFKYHRFDENRGGKSLARQWHRCLNLIENEQWLMILGDDDVLGPECVAEFYNQLPEIGDIGVVRFATVKIDAEGKSTSSVYENPKREKATDYLFTKQRSSLSEYVFKTAEVRKTGFKDFPLAWFSDILAVLEFSNFDTIYSVNQAIVYVRVSDFNISGRRDNLKPKADAVFYFHYYLLTKKRHHFSRDQQLELLQRLTKSYLVNKKPVTRFFKISALLIQMGELAKFVKFVKSFFAKSLGR